MGVDSKSNTGEEDIPKKSNDALSRCEVSKSSLKQEDILEMWGKEAPLK